MAEKPETKAEKKVVLESGIEVKPVYGPEDTASIPPEKTGKPGEYPFTRGIHPRMYRARPWTMRQYAGFGTPSESNQRFKFLISHGQDALNVAFDLPTQLGLDSDDPRADGEVGRVGMAVDTLADVERAFEGIPLDKVSVSLTINAPSIALIPMYEAVAGKQGVAPGNIRGTAQNDILKEYIGRGMWVFPVEPSVRLTVDTIEYCTRNLPKYYPVSICGYHIRESGANPVQEVAYAFEIAKAYAHAAVERGLKPDDFLPRFSFNFDIHGNLFEQVAKFRAARRLWAVVVKDELGGASPESQKMKMIAGGGGGALTVEEPENNIVRGAYYALISALSGTQTMALCSYDEAYTIPSEKAALISLRTMQILADEMGLCDTADPLGGSYYIEALTGELEGRMREAMHGVDMAGGVVRCISEGRIQREVARQAYEYRRRVERGEVVKVGVNRYRREGTGEPQVEYHEYRTAAADEQMARLREVRRSRDGAAVERALARLKAAARGRENLYPMVAEAAAAYCTLGEIMGTLKGVFGEFREPALF